MAVNRVNLMEDEQSLNLDQYYHLVTEHKWTIIVTLFLVVAAAVYYNSGMPSIYRATATLIIDKDSAKSPITGQETNYETYLSESLTFNTHFELITSRQVLEQTVIKLGLDQAVNRRETGKPKNVNPVRKILSQYRDNLLLLLSRKKPQPPPVDKMTGLVNVLRGIIAIENIDETRLLKIHASYSDPEMARNVANELANAYIDFNISNRMKSSQDTLTWLTDHLYEMKKKLEDAEADFLSYKQQAKLISIEGKQQLIAQKITEFNDAYLQTRNRRLELDSILEQLEQFSRSGRAIPHVRSLIASEQINTLHNQLVQSEMDLSRLAKVYKSKHPKIVRVKTDIEQTRSQLRLGIKKELDNLKAERALLVDKEKVLQQTIADFESEGMETNKRELQHGILNRNVQTNQSIYDALLARLKEADITENLYVSNIRIVENATLPRVPVGPNKTRNLIVAVFVGLFLGFCLGILKENLDRTLHTEEDIQKYLGLTVLSVIPKAEKGKDRVYGPSAKGPGQKVEKPHDISK